MASKSLSLATTTSSCVSSKTHIVSGSKSNLFVLVSRSFAKPKKLRLLIRSMGASSSSCLRNNSREYWNTKTPGICHCVCCDTPLFDGTGWPSYYEPIGNDVKSKLDLSIIFMPREEVLCSVCDAHLGHVFGDGPPESAITSIVPL